MENNFIIYIFSLIIFLGRAIEENICAPKSFGFDNIVCVCNATYCDFIDEVPLVNGSFVRYISSKQGLRFHKEVANFSDIKNLLFDTEIIINKSVLYQSIIGFGGGFTDATGINILSLSSEAQNKLLKSYFSKDGLFFNVGRVPIAGCDFSLGAYSYDDVVGDVNLTHFNLSEEDFNFKIPIIKRAQQIRERKLKLFASAWSPPPWTKTNNKYTGFSLLKKEYYQYWADYHLKFFDEYERNGIEFWGVTTGNQPLAGIIPIIKFNSLGWTPDSQRQWVSENFGPSIRKSRHRDLKILCLDDQRILLPWWVDKVLENNSSNYVDGIAVHWYLDIITTPEVLVLTHDHFPNKFIISAEACPGRFWNRKLELGSWERGEMYMSNIIQNMNHWVTGWVVWNLALNQEGGPNWASNFADAEIIVNAAADEFYKQPTFYALGHFSKFVTENSTRIDLHINSEGGVEGIAFSRPDGVIVIVIYNSDDIDRKIVVRDADRSANFDLPKRSFHTVLYKAI